MRVSPILPALFVAALISAQPLFAIELTQLEGSAHGFPAWLDINGKKMADGEFRQWMQDDRLHVVISYRFPDGQFYEENALFRQEPELMQEKWSWKELKNGKVQREFTVDFLAKTGSAHLLKDGESKDVSETVEIEPGRTFAGFGLSIALSNLRPRLLKGEQIELNAVGFSTIPTLKPLVVAVKVSHVGLERMKMAGRYLKGDHFVVRAETSLLAKLFVHVPDSHIWLTNPTPAEFLRTEGPIVLPNDPMRRVDLVSGTASGPAKPTQEK